MVTFLVRRGLGALFGDSGARSGAGVGPGSGAGSGAAGGAGACSTAGSDVAAAFFALASFNNLLFLGLAIVISPI